MTNNNEDVELQLDADGFPTPDSRMEWATMGVWNNYNSVSLQKEAEGITAEPRNYIRSSELGKSLYDRYHKMIGTPVTNPFNPRLLRVFEVGNYYESYIKLLYKMMGIFIDSQDTNGEHSLIPATSNTIAVMGHYDVKVGGLPKSEAEIREICKPWIDLEICTPYMIERALIMAEQIRQKGGLKTLLYEVKTINSQAFWGNKNYLDKPYPHHVLQLYSYLKSEDLKGNKIDQGRVLYFSKDDAMLVEFPVFYPDPNLEQILTDDIAQMSHYILLKQEPPKPESVVFNKNRKLKFIRNKQEIKLPGIWEANWEVKRSPYFERITGHKTTAAWEEAIKVDIAEKNQALKDEYDKSLIKA